MDGKLWKMSEKSEINGGPYQYDDYGTVDKTRIRSPETTENPFK
jgi:hypothetical protein